MQAWNDSKLQLPHVLSEQFISPSQQPVETIFQKKIKASFWKSWVSLFEDWLG